MMGKTHGIIGAAVGTTLIVQNNLPFNSNCIILFCSIIGSLLADLDHPKAFINQKLGIKNAKSKIIFYSLLGVFFVTSFYYYKLYFLIYFSVLCFLIGVSKHRAFTHSILAIVFYSLGLYYFSIYFDCKYIFTSFVLGYISHILADMLTKQGVELFYPLHQNIRFPITTTTKNNSLTENCIHVLAGLYIIFAFFNKIQISLV